jgi:Fic family protein
MDYSFIKFRESWIIKPDTWFKLGQCKGIIDSISSTPLKPDYRNKLFNVSLIKGAMSTTAIEGNTLSEDEVRQIHEGKKLSISKAYMGIEVKNVLDALNSLSNELLDKKNVKYLSPELIMGFHKMIGKDLGEHFAAIPGKFRTHDVTVGNYRPPNYQNVPDLINNLCKWSRSYFHYPTDITFSMAIIQAIVIHVYIAWIHPFGDGNGRTARLLEFYIMLRAGVPDIAAHILSNHYNNTRSEYYLQLGKASLNGGDLTNFLEYAIQGFKDGLKESLSIIQKNQLENAWQNYIQEISNSIGKSGVVARRRMQLITILNTDTFYPMLEYMMQLHPPLKILYSNLSERTLYRDVEALKAMNLISQTENGYKVNIDILKGTMPVSLEGIAL